MGIDVPGKVAIVGFDNWEIMSAATRPALTSVDLNLKDLGREAGVRMIDMIGGAHLKGVHRLPCTLVVRDSCGANRQRRA
jgi:LacI family transcriptional regulator